MYQQLLEQLKKAWDDPTFQQMKKATQGTKQSEKTVDSPERRKKSKRLKTGGSQVDVPVDIPKD